MNTKHGNLESIACQMSDLVSTRCFLKRSLATATGDRDRAQGAIEEFLKQLMKNEADLSKLSTELCEIVGKQKETA
jgi:hypothetical protein